MRADPLTGQTIGPYRIGERLAAGGIGAVYGAQHARLGTRVAVKVVSPARGITQDAIERCFHDARAVNAIRHPRIVDVLELGMLEDGRPFLVMEELAGVTLARASLPADALARVAGEVREALAAGHAHGIAHRELCADSIVVAPDGHAKLLDFGIASLVPRPRPRPAGEGGPGGDLKALDELVRGLAPVAERPRWTRVLHAVAERYAARRRR